MSQKRIGYARVSTSEQNLDLQIDALTSAGCKQIRTDTASGGSRSRPGLQDALDLLQEGDTLVVWRLDRLGRSLGHLVDLVAGLERRGVNLRSISDSIDTTSAGGRLIFHIMGSLAEFERNLISERTRAGLTAAQRRGIAVGRRRALTPAQVAHAGLLIDGGESASNVARTLGVGRSTLYRAIEQTGTRLQPMKQRIASKESR